MLNWLKRKLQDQLENDFFKAFGFPIPKKDSPAMTLAREEIKKELLGVGFREKSLTQVAQGYQSLAMVPGQESAERKAALQLANKSAEQAASFRIRRLHLERLAIQSGVFTEVDLDNIEKEVKVRIAQIVTPSSGNGRIPTSPRR